MTQEPPSHETLVKLGDVNLWAETALDAIDRLIARERATERVAFADITEQVIVARHLAYGAQMTVVWAANHLVTSYERLPRSLRDRFGSRPTVLHTTVQHLRDVFEHWDQHRGSPEPKRAHKRLREVNPEAAPWTTSWTQAGGIVLANCLVVDDLRSWVSHVREASASMLLDGINASHNTPPPGQSSA